MILGSILAVVFLGLAGDLTLRLVCSNPAKFGRIQRLGLGFGLGLIVVTLWLFALSKAGIKPARWAGLLEIAVLAALAALIRRGGGPSGRAGTAAPAAGPPQSHPETAWMERTILVFLVCVMIAVSAVSLLEPLVEWDVLCIWALKAKVLAEQPVAEASYFGDPSKAYSHLDYPLLWPLAMAWIWTWAGPSVSASTEALVTVKILAPAMLGAFVFSFYGFLRKNRTGLEALLFTAVLLSIPMLLSQTSRLLSDVPLSFFAMNAVALCYSWLEADDRDDLRLAGFFAAGMLFTKNEGMGLAILVTVAALAACLARGNIRKCRPVIFWLLIVPWLLTAAWFSFRLQVPKLHEDYGARIHPAHFFQNVSRLPQIPLLALDYLADWEDWLILWPLAGLALAFTVREWTRPPVLFLFLCLALPFFLYGYIYVVSPWDVPTLMEMTANRLLLHLAPVAVLLVAELARRCRLLPLAAISHPGGMRNCG